MTGPAARTLFVVVSGVLLLAVGGGGQAPTSVAGTTRVGERPEANAVVWLEEAGSSPPATRRTVLEQKNLTFSPHVLAVRAGTTVEFPNRDRVFHNVFSFHDGKRFDLGMYPVGTVKDVTFGTAGLSRIFCNIHPNMAAYVLAVDSPHFAVSDAAGRFRIAGVTQREYVYHAWRPGGGTLTGKVAGSDGTLEIRWP